MTTPLRPLKPDVFWILAVLAQGDRHGYAILQEIEELSEGSTRLRPGPLYRRLASLLHDGWIEEVGASEPDAADEDPRRRYYRITDSGRHAAQAETQRMHHAVEIARAAQIGGES